jgi:hypothetical protein
MNGGACKTFSQKMIFIFLELCSNCFKRSWYFAVVLIVVVVVTFVVVGGGGGGGNFCCCYCFVFLIMKSIVFFV